jgi:hypothetical protein
MQLDISEEERELLADLLEQDFRELKEEIYHTETRSFKDTLKLRETALLSVLHKLGRDPASMVA